jgi:Holliday junction resolvase RusA-like endonuclease
MASKITLEIPRVPPSLNQIIGRGKKYSHPGDYKRLQQLWKDEIAIALSPRALLRRMRQLIEDEPPVKVRIQAKVYRKKLLDPDNLMGGFKPVLDVMKQLGIIKDDSPEWIEFPMPKQEVDRRRPRTILTLEYLE